ncbi:PPC domain-containing DNA-binding protein [Noviherbaspirillum sp. ST9]|uniref:PPC domain-containing DNA-binding protein n=1 Tax=Noviherbaspirillum sp. ST9 TaxID=3401606 RepID=UPI003B588792
MRFKIINNAEEKTYALVMEPGDEAISSLQAFCESEALTAARFTAIGAFRSAQLGYFDWEKKDYEKTPVDEQVEVLSLVGDVALHEGRPKIHAHVVLGKRDGSACGGHLLHGIVRPTLEVLLVESPGYLKRKLDPESGLPLIDIGA